MNSYRLLQSILLRAIMILTIVLIVLSLYFIYRNVWQIFAYSKQEIISRGEAPLTEFKADAYKTIEDNLENKKNKSEQDLGDLKNPFTLSQTTGAAVGIKP